MIIELQNLGKRFNRHWIFRKLSYRLETGNAYAIIGPNGSGKSTLLQVIAGAVEKSEGTIHYTDDRLQTTDGRNENLPTEEHYQHLSIATPYLELIEELTLSEFLAFHFGFKKILPGFTIQSIIDYIGLKDAAHKQVRYFSSGMKQRVKLAQAVFSNSPIVMLDEPTANLDLKGIALYKQLVTEFCLDRLLIICSNDENEIGFCKFRLDVSEFTPKV
jgi:ABC-type multidrug transport system ATPase subunit